MSDTVEERPPKVHYIGAPEFFNLNMACIPISEAFGFGCYLVGSSLKRLDHRDVDIRCILADEEFDRMFPGAKGSGDWTHGGWSILCSAVSEWLKSRTGLRIDFQFQKQTDANKLFSSKDGHHRNALGFFVKKQ